MFGLWKSNNNDNNNAGLMGSFNLFRINDSDDEFNFGKYFSLSLEERMYAFGIFFTLGAILSIIGIILIFFLNLIGFAITYTFGNICMIIATLFLFGPMKQIRGMFDSLHRGLSVAVYGLMILLTLLAAFLWKSGSLCILFVILQFIAYIWYTITSIPGGQTMCQASCGYCREIIV